MGFFSSVTRIMWKTEYEHRIKDWSWPEAYDKASSDKTIFTQGRLRWKF